MVRRIKEQDADAGDMAELDQVEEVVEESLEVSDDKTEVEAKASDDTTESNAAAADGTFFVQWDIKVDGKRFKPGDTVTLPAGGDDAARFLASGAIKATKD